MFQILGSAVHIDLRGGFNLYGGKATWPYNEEGMEDLATRTLYRAPRSATAKPFR